MTREELKDFVPIIQAFAEGKTIQYYYKRGKKWMDIDNLHVECLKTAGYRIKPEETSDNNPSVSTSEYHYECFDNGCTLAGEDIKMCAIGDDDSKKMLGELILADIIYHCNLTCSNKVKITVKIKSED